MHDIAKAVIVPSDPIAAYEEHGYGSWLERYYNPAKVFKEVFIVSLMEQGTRQAYGATIIGVDKTQFKSTVESISPNIIRAYGGFWPSDLVIPNRIKNIPIIVSLHDTDIDLIHDSVKYADTVICMTKAVKQQALKRGVNAAKIRIIPNRVDPSIFHKITDTSQLNAVAKLFPPGKHILHIGRKSPEKNIETLIRAMVLLPADYYSIFVGMGDPSPYIALAKSVGVENKCFWIDMIMNDQLPIWYSWCDCMCTPSLWEGFGIVFIEALACGAAIVTSNIAPLNEYMQHNINSCLVDNYQNPNSIAQAILKVCTDHEYRNKICAAAPNAAQPFYVNTIDALEAKLYLETARK